jgi:hypothetical protein
MIKICDKFSNVDRYILSINIIYFLTQIFLVAID